MKGGKRCRRDRFGNRPADRMLRDLGAEQCGDPQPVPQRQSPRRRLEQGLPASIPIVDRQRADVEQGSLYRFRFERSELDLRAQPAIRIHAMVTSGLPPSTGDRALRQSPSRFSKVVNIRAPGLKSAVLADFLV